MREGWNSAPLGEVTQIIKRGIAPKYCDDGGVRVINQKCIRNHSINYLQARRNDPSKKKIPEERFIRSGDVLVNSTGTGTLGRVAQVLSSPDEPTTVDTHVTIVRPLPEVFYQPFFGYCMIHIEDQLIKGGMGASGQTELPRADLETKFTISYPSSVEEQKAIVNKLDNLKADTDRLQEEYTRQLSDLDELKQSLLQKAFAGELT